MWKKIDFFVDEVLKSLNDGRRLDVTDDRDRIYPFLGLPVATDIRAILSINYEQTWETVFHDFACCYLDSTQDLNTLHFIQPSEATISANSKIPSRIPQWQHNVYDRPLYSEWQKKIVSQCIRVSPPYSRLGNSILRVRGLIMNSICFLSPSLSYLTTIGDMAAVRKTVGFYTNPTYKRFPPLYAFFEAISCGVRPSGLSDRQVKAQTEACLRCLDYGGPVLGGKISQGTSDATEDDLKVSGRLWQSIQGWLHNRRIAVTRRGYYCLVPGLAREGDTCAVIFGTILPFVLRGTGRPHYYKVVGDAFFTSSRKVNWEAGYSPYMMGSGYRANEDWLDWGLKEQDIWLC